MKLLYNYFGLIFLLSLSVTSSLGYEWRVGEAFVIAATRDQVPEGMTILKINHNDEDVENPFPNESQDDQFQETSTPSFEEIGTTNVYNESYNQETISSGVPQLPIPDGRQVYPWLVSIVKNGKQICTGTLIDNRHVLTTAYCIYNFGSKDLTELELQIGFQTAAGPRLRQFELHGAPFLIANVSKAIRHLRFNPTTAFNDIGLLQLETPIKFDGVLQPISLTEDSALYDNETLPQSIVGWRTGADLSDEDVLFWRDEPIRYKNTEDCRKNYGEMLAPHGISSEMICRGGDTFATTCNWKFGAPLVVKDGVGDDIVNVGATQLGIYSWGVEALLPECMFSEERPSPLVFTRVASYYKWIITNLVH